MASKASAMVTLSCYRDTNSITRYYKLGTSTPTKPTTKPPSGWSTTEPSYTSGSTNSLYLCDLIEFSDGTYTYSAVNKSSSYEAAKDAYNKAVSVETRITTAETSIEQNKTDISLRATKTELNALVEGNLVVNGFGLNKDNYNFSQWTFNGVDKCDGFPSFNFTGTSRDLLIPQYMIPIDINKKYEFKMSFKGDSSKKLYLGWDEFDIDGKLISATYCMGYSASTTTLAKDLKDGDTVVYLTSASGWTSSTAAHQLGLIFWNYKDSTGYQYPEGVYSRNAWINLYTFANVNKTNNTITLNSAWNHGTFPAGTKVSQSNSGGHKYFNYSNAYYPSDWTETSYIIGGIQELYKQQVNRINQAAKYMRFIILHNYGGGSTSSKTCISKISLRDVTLEKNLSDNYYTKTQTDAKIKVESDRITSAVSRISNNETAISTLEQTADGLTVRLDTTDSNVATAQSTADTAKTNAATAQSTANSVKTDLANNYTKKTLPDTRSDNQPPSWYFTNYPKQIITEFKSCSAIGLTGVGTYCSLQTIVPWGDSSGGYPKQTAKVESTGKEFWRVGTSASAWSSWIDPYALANTANTTANTAKTNAATAQTTANTARTEAANAAKTATNYLGFSSAGLVVGDMTASTLGKNVLIDSDSVDIRTGDTVLASFGANQVILGQNAANSEIELCDGAGVIKALTSGASTSYPKYDSIAIESQEIEMNCQRFVATITNVDGSTTPTYKNTAEIYTLSYKSSDGAYARMGGECEITSSGDIYQTGVSAMGLDDSTNTKTMLYTEFWDESANKWAASNQVSVFTNKTTMSKPIVIDGTWFTGKNKTLWSGGYYMSGTQTATLSEAISAQANGIVLIWSYYVDGAVDNSNFIPYFIPKQFVSLHNGKGISMFMTNGTMSVAASKYVYVSDTKLTGHANNDDAATTKNCGITSTPKQWVLRYVIGV